MNIRTPVKLLGVVAVLSTSACGIQSFNQPPEFSQMSLSKEDLPEARSIQIPMPEKPEAPELKRAARTSLWQHESDGFFGDKRAQNVGDILTVNIEIADRASLSSETETERSASNQVDFPTLLGYQNKLTDILPGIAAADLPDGNPLVDLGSERSLEGSGSVDRNERVSLKVAAMVIETLANGNLVIAGRQEVRVNHELRELIVAGVVQPQDITNQNSISYEKIAEARISYGGRGLVSDVQKPGFGKKALDIALPY